MGNTNPNNPNPQLDEEQNQSGTDPMGKRSNPDRQGQGRDPADGMKDPNRQGGPQGDQQKQGGQDTRKPT